MKSLIFALPGNEVLAKSLAKAINADLGEVIFRNFPDGETYVRVLSEVKNRKTIMVCTLANPDEKLLPLYFLSKTLKSLGADCTCLVAPYLAYMRQDKVFNRGEGVTSEYFASLIAGFADTLITIDPHLHRRNSLSEIYSIPTKVIQAAPYISKWVKENIVNPIIIGPDSESEQWVAEVAAKAKAPHMVLNKIRYGDRHVEVSLPDIDRLKNHTPILVDDIVSTAQTMIEAVKHIKAKTGIAPVCMCTHAIFADNSYNELMNSGIDMVISCNTIMHPSNRIDLTDAIANELK